MKSLLILILILIPCQSGAGLFSNFCSWALTVGGLNEKKLQAFVTKNAPVIGRLSDAEINLLKDLSKATKSDVQTLQLLTQYRGPRADLEKFLKWLVDLLVRVNAGTFDSEELLNYPGFEQLRESWKRRRTQKNVVPSISFEDPLPLIVAETVLQLEVAEFAAKHTRQLDGWASRVAVFILFKDDSAEYQSEIDTWIAQINSDPYFKEEIARIRSFLVYQDVMHKKLALYERLIVARPEFRTLFWERLRLASDPRPKIAQFLNQRMFGFGPALARKLEISSLVEIIGGPDNEEAP